MPDESMKEYTDWTFELSSIGKTGRVRWTLKNGVSAVLARSEECASLTVAHNMIENIKRHAIEFDVRSFPG